MDHWNVILNQARKCHQSQTEWSSSVQQKRYCFEYVNENTIIVKRLSGGDTASLGRKLVNNAIEKLRKAGRLKKRELNYTVAIETALVFLHPGVKWDAAADEILWINSVPPQDLDSTITAIQQADDDTLEKVSIEVNRRVNQGKFRRSILALYGGKCAISGTALEPLLEAAHINDHSVAGINSKENGILLRADLHRLFDRNLLRIHPQSLTVHLQPISKIADYMKFDGERISLPIDGSRPSEAYLQERWETPAAFPS